MLKILYWNQEHIAKFAGCSRPQAQDKLTKARRMVEDDGLDHLYENKVYNKYAIKALGIDLAFMDATGGLDADVIVKGRKK